MDRSSGDGTADCFRSVAATQAEEGLRFVFAEPADLADIAVVCLVADAESPVPTEVVVRGPLGRPWIASPLQLGESFRLSANSVTEVDATVVDAVLGSSLHPVGRTFVERGQRYVALYLAIPTSRPSGTWTVELAGQVAVMPTTAPCEASETQVLLWPLDPDLVYVADTFLEVVPQVANCRVAPDLSGLELDAAVTAFTETFATVGFVIADVDVDVECATEPSAGPFVVVLQTPSPGRRIDASGVEALRPSIDVRGACPAVPPVVGLTVDQARTEIIAVWPVGVEPSIAEINCDDGADIVTQAFPLPTGIPSKQITLRCD